MKFEEKMMDDEHTHASEHTLSPSYITIHNGTNEVEAIMSLK